MKAVIVEDEIIAAQNLQRLIEQIDNSIEVVAVLKSIKKSVEWFSANPAPDLVFMDIHLSDGSSFSIFEKVKIHAPIIFTTAYDEYALKAFEVNSVDYLLKPIDTKNLARAIEKFSHYNKPKCFDSSAIDGERASALLTNHSARQPNYEDAIANMLSMFQKEKAVYKLNFLIPHKDKFIPLSVNDIAYIYWENKNAKIVTFDHRVYYQNDSLDKIQQQIDPAKFFRANRQFIISRKAVKDISVWFDSKLSVNLTVDIPEKIIVSRTKASEFKEWYMK